MIRRRFESIAALVAALAAFANPASAHPAPFSYLDVRIQGRTLTVVVVAHVFDVGHDVGVSPPELLLDRSVLAGKGAAIAALFESRLQLRVDGRLIGAPSPSTPEPLTDRQALRLALTYDAGPRPGVVMVSALMFPYDPVHQTFLNFYDDDKLATQAILDAGLSRFEYFPGTTAGTGAAALRFFLDGIRHIVLGPDHLLFVAGLLLLGGSFGRRIIMVTAFTVAHSATLALAMFHLMAPSERIVEPAVAFSIVYLGTDNLLVQTGRDVRAWIAFAFGLIHGFSFATVMRHMGLSTPALISSLFAFNVGLEVGQVFVVVVVAWLLAALRSRSGWAERHLAVAGSLVLIAAGAFWFVERVFFYVFF